jgi:porin
MVATVDAQEASIVADDDQQATETENPQPDSSDATGAGLMSESVEDPGVLLSQIEQRRFQKGAVLQADPLRPLHDAADKWAVEIEGATRLKLGAAFNHLFMWLSESPLGEDEYGVASALDLLGTMELANVGEPNQGQLFFQFQGRWEYGPPGPEVIGTENLGSLVGTANTFSAYTPTFLLRNLYWQQGTREAGWIFRVGKITTDATLSTSAHIASPITFLPTAGTGPFANALTDSGLGIAATWFINDRFKVLGIISDANADRSNFGDITEGDFYSAVEFAYKIAPRTQNAGYSKLTLWHTDATKNGQAVNGHLGPQGYGFFIKHEQELTADGRLVAVFRYGKSYKQSAVYEEQFGAHFLFYNPTKSGLQNDLLGVAVNWAQANVSGARLESNVEVFYRFPIIRNLDMTFSYQSLINLALDPNNHHASAFGLRLRTTF